MAARLAKRLGLALAIAGVEVLIRVNAQIQQHFRQVKKWTKRCLVNKQQHDCLTQSDYRLAEDIEEFRCPISHEVMRRPVRTPHGHCFDAKAIKKWLRQNCTCPITRQVLSASQLIPCTSLAQQITQHILQKKAAV